MSAFGVDVDTMTSSSNGSTTKDAAGDACQRQQAKTREAGVSAGGGGAGNADGSPPPS